MVIVLFIYLLIFIFSGIIKSYFFSDIHYVVVLINLQMFSSSGEDMVLLAAVADSAERAVDNSVLVLDNQPNNYAVNIETLPPPPPPNNLKINSEPTTYSTATTTTTNVYGRLCYKDEILYITEHAIKIGRNSSTSTVHFHVGKNSFVSRKHLQVSYDRSTSNFYLMCLSKNGVFVNDVFQRKSSEPLKLPKT